MMTTHIETDELDTSDLLAYAPTGVRITSTLEAATTQYPITYFYKDDDGSFIHEYSSSGQDGADTATVVIDGQTVYFDENGALWLESALTYKTRDGDIVQVGTPMEPLTDVDVCKSLGAAIKNKSADESAGEARWISVCNKQGWNDDSQITLLEGFIREQGLMSQLAAHAARAAAEESSESTNLAG